MIDLNFFAKIKLIKQERKVLEDLLNEFIKKNGPKGFPSSVISSEKVQSHSKTKEAETIYKEWSELLEEIEVREFELAREEIRIIREIKRIKDDTIRTVIYARYVLDMSFKEIETKYGINRQDFFNRLNKNDKKYKNIQK